MRETLRRIEGEIRQILRSIPAQEPLMWPVRVGCEYMVGWDEYRVSILHWPRVAEVVSLNEPIGMDDAVARHFGFRVSPYELQRDYTRSPISAAELRDFVERTYANLLLELAVERDPLVIRAREVRHRAQLSGERHDQRAADRRLFTDERDTRDRIATEYGIPREPPSDFRREPYRRPSWEETVGVTLGSAPWRNLVTVQGLYADLQREMNELAQRLLGRVMDPAQKAERVAAEERAEELLKAHLTDEQLDEYKRAGWFTVVGSDTGKRYRIKFGRQQNVFELNERGEECMGWCFTPIGRLAPGDCMLAQKIALEGDEAHTLRVANRFGFAPPGDWMLEAGLYGRQHASLEEARQQEEMMRQQPPGETLYNWMYR